MINLLRGSSAWVGIGLFVLGVFATVVALQIPATAEALRDLENSGYFGAIVTGVLYGISLTSATATVIYASMPETLNPLVVAVLGGLGSVLYDFGIFSLLHRDGIRGKIQSVADHFHHPKFPLWLSYLIGGALIASPLPDELGAGFLAFHRMPLPMFLAISFVCNTIGVLIITGLF